MVIKFHWNTATFIQLVHVLCGCFHTITAELSSYDRNCRPTKLKLFTICPLQEKKMAETWSTPLLRKDVTVGLNLRSALGAGDGGHVWTRSHFQDVEGVIVKENTLLRPNT